MLTAHVISEIMLTEYVLPGRMLTVHVSTTQMCMAIKDWTLNVSMSTVWVTADYKGFDNSL